MARNGIDIRMQLPTDADLRKLFDAVPQLRRYQVMPATTRAGGQVVVKRAKQLAPRSTPADRKKRSKKQRAEANWDGKPLHRSVAMVTRNYERASVSVVGPKHPDGNKAWFNSPKSGHRLHVLWGKAGGRRTKLAIRNWIVRAFDETRPQQLEAMKLALKKRIAEMLS
jgi:hypothetical protein